MLNLLNTLAQIVVGFIFVGLCISIIMLVVGALLELHSALFK